MTLCIATNSYSQDMSHCIGKKYLSKTAESELISSYVDFHSQYSLPEEYTSERLLQEEAAQVAEMINLQQCMIETRYKGETFKRGFHAKAHGCVNTKVNFLGNGQGIFASKGVKEGIVRFSNGAVAERSDHYKDIRGFALKVFDTSFEPLIESETEREIDFLLINSRNMPTANFKEFMNVTKLAESGLLGFFEKIKITTKLLLSGLANSITIKLNDVRGTDYHSATPYKYGQNHAVKYRVRPIDCGNENPIEKNEGHGDDFLRERLASTLDQGPLCFELALQQKRLDEKNLNLNDDRTTWSGDDFKTVAKLTLNDLISDDACESLTFNPWHTAFDHKPLGSANRARSHIYRYLSSLRQH